MTWIDIALLVYVGGGTWYLERELKPGAPANLDPNSTQDRLCWYAAGLSVFLVWPVLQCLDIHKALRGRN